MFHPFNHLVCKSKKICNALAVMLIEPMPDIFLVGSFGPDVVRFVKFFCLWVDGDISKIVPEFFHNYIPKSSVTGELRKPQFGYLSIVFR